MEEGRPTGEAEVIESLLRAAATLFSTTDPGAVSLRAIADAAGVNYGLVHRHLGTKADLVAATVRRHSERFLFGAGSGAPNAHEDAGELLRRMARHYLDGPAVARTLAWASLHDADPQRLVAGLGDVEMMVDALESSTGDADEARLLFAFAASSVLGLTIFGPLALASAGFSPDDAARALPALEDYTLSLLVELVGGHRAVPAPDQPDAPVS